MIWHSVHNYETCFLHNFLLLWNEINIACYFHYSTSFLLYCHFYTYHTRGKNWQSKKDTKVEQKRSWDNLLRDNIVASSLQLRTYTWNHFLAHLEEASSSHKPQGNYWLPTWQQDYLHLLRPLPRPRSWGELCRRPLALLATSFSPSQVQDVKWQNHVASFRKRLNSSINSVHACVPVVPVYFLCVRVFYKRNKTAVLTWTTFCVY